MAQFIAIEWISGRGNAEDESRAEDVALAVFKAAGVDPADAQSEYERQWIEFDDQGPMTGLALVWIKAERAANLAATETWDNPDGGYVTINCQSF